MHLPESNGHNQIWTLQENRPDDCMQNKQKLGQQSLDRYLSSRELVALHRTLQFASDCLGSSAAYSAWHHLRSLCQSAECCTGECPVMTTVPLVLMGLTGHLCADAERADGPE